MASLSASAIQAAMVEKLSFSCLSAKDAKQLGFVSMPSDSLQKLLPNERQIRGGFKIPYFDLEGAPIDFFRFRFLEKAPNGFAKLVDLEEHKYSQPQAPPELYLPPLHKDPKLTWASIASDSSIPLFVTEGELKAACACKHGFPTIGLGGVWNFMSSKNGWMVLPQFSEFVWTGRHVTIIFDSDSAINPNIVSAENRLAKEYTKLGAAVHIARIPPSGKSKIGVDDYILAHGAPAFFKLINDEKFVSAWSMNRCLHELSQDYMLIKNPTSILRLSSMQLLTEKEFHLLEAGRKFEEIVTTVTTKGTLKNQIVKRWPSKEWIDWSLKPAVERVTYRPGEPRICVDKDGKPALNGWKGWAIEPKEGDVSLVLKLFYRLTEKEPQYRKYILQWLAYPLQHPGTKLHTSILMWGHVRGTGKSFFGDLMESIYGENYVTVTDEQLTSPFNTWIVNRQFGNCDEIAATDSNESRAIESKFKRMVVRHSVTVNEKGIKTYDIPDCVNYYITSQHADALHIDHASERRYLVVEVIGDPLEEKFFEELRAWARPKGSNTEFRKENLAAWFHYLLNVDLTGFNPYGKAPFTESAEDMMEAGMSDLSLLAHRLVEEPELVLQVNGVASTRSLWTVKELYDAVKEAHPRVKETGLGRALRVAGLSPLNSGKKIHVTQQLKLRLWPIFDREKLKQMPTAEIGQLCRQERGLEQNITTYKVNHKITGAALTASGKK